MKKASLNGICDGMQVNILCLCRYISGLFDVMNVIMTYLWCLGNGSECNTVACVVVVNGTITSCIQQLSYLV